jgi:hypothetical protein
LSQATDGSISGIIEAVGDVQLTGQLEELLTDRAFACGYGAPPDGQRYSPRWRHANVREQLCLWWVCDLLKRGLVPVDRLLSHRWPMAQLIEAFQLVQTGQVLKGIIGIPA